MLEAVELGVLGGSGFGDDGVWILLELRKVE